MREERILRKLASAARADGPPRIDVADWVVDDIAAAIEPRRLLLWAFTGVSSAAASIVTILAVRIWQAQQDPMADLIQSMAAVMQ